MNDKTFEAVMTAKFAAQDSIKRCRKRMTKNQRSCRIKTILLGAGLLVSVAALFFTWAVWVTA
ncbi:MAG: hypothetical protein JWL87_315 [Candidatus Adlerbacteria bacterium]|nr:hypothetical protein [Candidatus Adlerbacteria bacterium]